MKISWSVIIPFVAISLAVITSMITESQKIFGFLGIFLGIYIISYFILKVFKKIKENENQPKIKAYWLIGGIIGVIIPIVLYFSFILISYCIVQQNLCSYHLAEGFSIIGLILISPITFLIGAFIGWIVGKIKFRNQEEKVEIKKEAKKEEKGIMKKLAYLLIGGIIGFIIGFSFLTSFFETTFWIGGLLGLMLVISIMLGLEKKILSLTLSVITGIIIFSSESFWNFTSKLGDAHILGNGNHDSPAILFLPVILGLIIGNLLSFILGRLIKIKSQKQE